MAKAQMVTRFIAFLFANDCKLWKLCLRYDPKSLKVFLVMCKKYTYLYSNVLKLHIERKRLQ